MMSPLLSSPLHVKFVRPVATRLVEQVYDPVTGTSALLDTRGTSLLVLKLGWPTCRVFASGAVRTLDRRI